ncbi:unnamed protein product [Urochloa humidicola]
MYLSRVRIPCFNSRSPNISPTTAGQPYLLSRLPARPSRSLSLAAAATGEAPFDGSASGSPPVTRDSTRSFFFDVQDQSTSGAAAGCFPKVMVSN